MTKDAWGASGTGSLLRTRPITSAVGAPGSCLPHNDSGEPNWFVYSPTLTNNATVVRTTGGSESTTAWRISAFTQLCTGGATCTPSILTNQGISYLIRSEESNAFGGGGTACVQAAALFLQVSMVGVAHDAGRVSWETASESGAVGFIVEHDDGTGFAPITGTLPALAEPGGGVYAARVPRHLNGPIRVVEVDTLGIREAYLVGGEQLTQLLPVSAAEPFLAVPHPPAISVGPKDLGAASPGEVARVLVRGEGLVRVTPGALAEAFGVSEADVAADIQSGSLSVSDGSQAVAYAVSEDGDIVFFAAPADHVFSDERHFFVRRSGGATRTSSLDGAPGLGAEDSTYLREYHLEQEAFAATVVLEDPRADLWFWHVVAPASPLVAAVRVEAPAQRDSAVDVHIHTVPGYDGTVSLWIDGALVGDAQPTQGRVSLRFSVDAALLAEGDREIQIRIDSGFVYVDSIDLLVATEFGSGDALFTAEQSSIARLPQTDGLRVFDVTHPSAVRLLSGLSTDGTTARFQTVNGHRYLVDRGDPPPLAHRVVGANPRDLTSLTGDYLVITHSDLSSALGDLLDQRASEGLSPVVVEVQDIFDAYSAGAPDPGAIRSFIADARAGWSTPPRYVLLAGHGTYDYRDVRASNDNFIPALVTPTASGLYGSDALFVSQSAWAGPEIPIGRLPARSVTELSSLIGRILAFEAREHDSVLAVADRASGGDDYTLVATTTLDQWPSAMQHAFVAQTGPVEDARLAVRDALALSPDSVMYFGHGGLDRIGRDGLLRTEDLANLDASGSPGVHFMMSCAVGRFAVPGFDSLSEELLRLPHGAVAVFGPSGQTNLADTEALAGPLARGVFQDGMRLGDATLAATRSYGSDYDAARLFNLLGDPAMRTGAPLVVDPPTDDAGVPLVMVDGGGDADGVQGGDMGGPVGPPPAGGMGGGACSAGQPNSSVSGIFLLLAMVTWARRLTRRKGR